MNIGNIHYFKKSYHILDAYVCLIFASMENKIINMIMF